LQARPVAIYRSSRAACEKEYPERWRDILESNRHPPCITSAPCAFCVKRRAVALASALSRQVQIGMNAAHPVDQKNDLDSLGVDIGNHFVDDGAHDALL
jgi:hypothetical protein